MNRRLASGAAAALVLILYTQLSRYLPFIAGQAGAAVSVLVAAPLFAVIIVGLWPLRRLGHWLLVVAAGGVALAALFIALGWIPGSNIAKALAAAGVGFWLASQVEELWWYIPVAVLSAGVDLISVFAGPTKVLLAQGPKVVGYFTVAMPWWGVTWHRGSTALGVSDLIFFAFYYAAAERFGLRRVLTVVCMVASFIVTVIVSFQFSALPALPLLAVGFVAPNADLLWRALRQALGRADGGDAG